MINAFELVKGRLKQIHIETADDLRAARPIWIDFDAPTEEERIWVKQILDTDLPEEDEVGDIEASARFFQGESGELHIRSDFLLDDDEEGSRNVRVAFMIKGEILFSLHHEDLPVFRLVRMRARLKPGSVGDAMDVLLDLYATDAEYSADALEEVYEALEAVSRSVLKNPLSDTEAADALARIAREEDVNGRIRRNVMDTRRAVSFLMRHQLLTAEQAEEARQILRDIDSLDGHTSFLFDKINFLMDATVGFININQNKIVKIFSVASVGLLPPTLIASIYGMNYEHMPELQWEYGYAFSIGLMLASVILPFWIFRKKGWLR
ncbi:MAG TPA: magnesium/cobalt transporter CorA [Rhodocyclaceae bacterium]|nr:magnesium/cobalt transporter CorA [Rhodocyclaceae bacterium]